MTPRPPDPITPAETRRRRDRARRLARAVGFVGRVLYRHAPTDSGGAQFVPGQAGDTLVVYAEAFRRDANPDDFSLRAIVAHERGHQVLARDRRLAARAAGLPVAAEEVLASLIGARLVGPGSDREALVAKAAADLLDAGVGPDRAARLVGDLWGLLGELL
ncbi:MAG: hypothetical protein K2X82_05195 [Gemmataceae bacterium]|nr:hypothetical protein [Gemmataceae bacterium]